MPVCQFNISGGRAGRHDRPDRSAIGGSSNTKLAPDGSGYFVGEEEVATSLLGSMGFVGSRASTTLME